MIRGTLCDVTLTTVDTSIPCHRLLLAANSDYFAAMFTGRYSGQYQDHWCIFRWNVGAESGNCGNTGCGWCSSETTGGILLLRWNILYFIYYILYIIFWVSKILLSPGKLTLQEDTVENITIAACLLQLPAVVEACCSFFKKVLHPSNCIGIRLFADSQSCIQVNQLTNHDNFQHWPIKIQLLYTMDQSNIIFKINQSKFEIFKNWPITVEGHCQTIHWRSLPGGDQEPGVSSTPSSWTSEAPLIRWSQCLQWGTGLPVSHLLDQLWSQQQEELSCQAAGLCEVNTVFWLVDSD